MQGFQHYLSGAAITADMMLKLDISEANEEVSDGASEVIFELYKFQS